jgi:hypothetical protein
MATGCYQLSCRLIGHTAFSWHMVPAVLYLALLYSAALRALHIGNHHGDLLGIAGAIITCYTQTDLALVPSATGTSTTRPRHRPGHRGAQRW